MCLAALALQAHPHWQLVIAANRDEYHDRPADPLAAWTDGTGIIAGRDVQAGGTWLGVGPAHRMALVTNVRVPGYPQPGRPSRGQLVTDLLTGAAPESHPLGDFNPFNLLLIDGGIGQIVTNHPATRIATLSHGLHGLSNGPVDPPWLKTHRVMTALADWLSADPATGIDPLFAALHDTTPTEQEWRDGGPEPRLSAPFIVDPTYGTRCSTVMTVDHTGTGRIIERRFAPDGVVTGETALAFQWPTVP